VVKSQNSDNWNWNSSLLDDVLEDNDFDLDSLVAGKKLIAMWKDFPKDLY